MCLQKEWFWVDVEHVDEEGRVYGTVGNQLTIVPKSICKYGDRVVVPYHKVLMK